MKNGQLVSQIVMTKLVDDKDSTMIIALLDFNGLCELVSCEVR
jgi:hypothetical protein